MALERTYNIPLRREWLKAPKYRRAKRAVRAVEDFLQKHMKSDTVKIGQYLNEAIWARGIKSPPHHVEVKVTKDDKGVVMAELVGAPVQPAAEVKKAPEAKAVAEVKPAEQPAKSVSTAPQVKAEVEVKPVEVKKAAPKEEKGTKPTKSAVKTEKKAKPKSTAKAKK